MRNIFHNPFTLTLSPGTRAPTEGWSRWVGRGHYAAFILVFLSCSRSGAPTVTQGMTAGECLSCHRKEDITEVSTLSQKDHMIAAGLGIPLTGPAGVLGLSIGGPQMELWITRGKHSSEDLRACTPCHLKHPSFSYPGTDCASSCHDWLTSVQGTGFTNTAGRTGSFSGSIRPADLLGKEGTQHSKIWRMGYAAPPGKTSVKVAVLKPGCTGCHNAFAKEHGTIPRCTDCHNFSGSGGIHGSHIELIQASRASADPAHMPMPVCGYCHPGYSTEGFSGASCYLCHLSAHDTETPYWIP